MASPRHQLTFYAYPLMHVSTAKLAGSRCGCGEAPIPAFSQWGKEKDGERAARTFLPLPFLPTHPLNACPVSALLLLLEGEGENRAKNHTQQVTAGELTTASTPEQATESALTCPELVEGPGYRGSTPSADIL